VPVTAPPRPPHQGDPIDRAELEALVEALIEEARQRQQRRRRILWAVAAVAALVMVVVITIFDRAAQSGTASPASAAPASPAAAPAPSRIALVAGVPKSSPSGGFWQTELYVMNADGSGLRRLVRHESGLGPEPSFGGPAWSPDGQKLAFVKRLGPPMGQCVVCHGEIFVMNADGSGQRNLTGNAGGGVPAWSPDGQTIAFSRDTSSTPNLYVMNADGSGQRRVTKDPIHAWGPSWSPDGQRLAFTGGVPVQRGPVFPDIYVVNVDGSGQQQLTRHPLSDQDPVWSPDGRKIAFQGFRDGQPAIYVMNADGTAQRKLTRTPYGEGWPAWSPDGRKIVFVRWPLTRPQRKWGRDEEIYVVNADGTGLRNLTRTPGRDTRPAWSPDGRTIGFESWRLGNRDLYVMNADGSRQRNFTRGLDQALLGFAWSPAQQK
jgi:TolB protein